MSTKVKESTILKALRELEDFVEKGDALEEADTEGGLSTEGKPLSTKAKKSTKSEVVKAEEESSDDESSSDDSSSKKKGKPFGKSGCDHVFDGQIACKSCTGSVKKASDDASSDDGSDDEDEDTNKSLRGHADRDETMRKAFDVAPFLEGIVDNLSEALEDQRTLLTKAFEERIETVTSSRRDFDVRLAKAIVRIGNSTELLKSTVTEMAEAFRKVLNLPHVPQRRMVLSKSEIVEPALGGQSEEQNPIYSIPRAGLVDWLVRKSQSGEIPEELAIQFESCNYDPAVLDQFPHVKKALVNDLCKS